MPQLSLSQFQTLEDKAALARTILKVHPNNSIASNFLNQYESVKKNLIDSELEIQVMKRREEGGSVERVNGERRFVNNGVDSGSAEESVIRQEEGKKLKELFDLPINDLISEIKKRNDKRLADPKVQKDLANRGISGVGLIASKTYEIDKNIKQLNTGFEGFQTSFQKLLDAENATIRENERILAVEAQSPAIKFAEAMKAEGLEKQAKTIVPDLTKLQADYKAGKIAGGETVLPAPSAPAEPSKIYTIQKRGDVWDVLLDGKAISTASNEQTARSQAQRAAEKFNGVYQETVEEPAEALARPGEQITEEDITRVLAQFPDANRENAIALLAGQGMVHTPPFRELTPEYRQTLEREAPETLREPRRAEFDTEEHYQNALQRFRQYGHWATEEGGIPIVGGQARTPEEVQTIMEAVNAGLISQPISGQVTAEQAQQAIDTNTPIIANPAGLVQFGPEGSGPQQETQPRAPSDNLFSGDDEGNVGTIIQPPVPPAPPPPISPPPTGVPPTGAPPAPTAPPTGTAPPTDVAPPVTETIPTVPDQISTQAIVDGMLAGVDDSVKKLIKEMTDKFGTKLDAYQKGQEVNEEELNAQFEELKTKNINPYFKQLITNYQTDLLNNLGVLTGQRAMELEGQKVEFENQTRNVRATLEASGLSFSGEALRLLGASAAFGQRELPQGMEQRAAEPLQMTEIPEGQVPQSQRLMATSRRARFTEQLRNLSTSAERALGSANIPEALRLAGFAGPAGEPTAGQFLAGGQIGDVERQKREAELAGLEALRGVQTATKKVNALGQPL